MPHFFLPLAISFFTFEQISYLVDADAGKTHNYSLLDYALFVAYFPHLIAGPIVRHNDLIPQFRQVRARNDDLATGMTLFTIGLAKKTLLADNLAPFADAIFNAAGRGTHLGMSDSWLGTLFFAFQIYFDFSAYSDMALGSSVMLGIRLPVNFHSPYKSASIIEFWRRWHISLSAFLRDYLYIPLGGNRRGRGRRYVNLFITMLLGGLWHGAAWTFMLWGGLHGFYLTVNHAFRHATKGVTAPPKWHLPLRAASVLLTFAATTLAWIVFRAQDLAAARNVLGGFVGAGTFQHRQLLAAGRRGVGAAVWPGVVDAQRHRAAVGASPRPALALCRAAGRAGTPPGLAAHAAAGRPVWRPVHRGGAGAVEPETLHLLSVLKGAILMEQTRYPVWFLGTVLAGTGGAGGDSTGPRAHISSPIRMARPYETLSGFERALKPVWLEQVQPDTVFVGSSRVRDGFDPTLVDPAFHIRSFNYGASSIAPYEARRFAQDALAHVSVKRVVVALDAFTGNGGEGEATPSFDETRLAVTPSGAPTPRRGLWLFTTRFLSGGALGMNAQSVWSLLHN